MQRGTYEDGYQNEFSPSNQEGRGIGDSQLTYYLRVFSKRKWPAILFAVVVIGAVAYQTKRQVPKYEATVTVMIERKPPRVLAGTAEVVELGNTNYWSNKEYYQTKIDENKEYYKNKIRDHTEYYADQKDNLKNMIKENKDYYADKLNGVSEAMKYPTLRRLI